MGGGAGAAGEGGGSDLTLSAIPLVLAEVGGERKSTACSWRPRLQAACTKLRLIMTFGGGRGVRKAAWSRTQPSMSLGV